MKCFLRLPLVLLALFVLAQIAPNFATAGPSVPAAWSASVDDDEIVKEFKKYFKK